MFDTEKIHEEVEGDPPGNEINNPALFDAVYDWQEPWAIIDDFDGSTKMLCVWLPISHEQAERFVTWKEYEKYTQCRDSDLRPASTMPFWARATKFESAMKPIENE